MSSESVWLAPLTARKRDAGIDSRGLVLEHAHRVVCARLRTPGRIALPDTTLLVLLAGEPRAPRRRAAGAVRRRAVENPVGLTDPAVAAEAHGTRPTFALL